MVRLVMKTKKHFTYIIECADGTYYTGYTTDVKRRVKEHNQGIGSKYTRSRLPVSLLYFEKYSSRSKAMKREYEIKSLTRREKEEIINGK